MLGVSRNTLRKYLSRLDGDAPDARMGKLDSFSGELQRMFSEQPSARAMAFFRRLKEAGYLGSYDLVKRKVRTMRAETPGFENPPPELPGFQAEADLGRVRLAMPADPSAQGGRDCFLFSMTLRYSGRIYAELLENPDMDAFLECHRRAFAFFQGVPREVIYERHRNKWLRRLTGSKRFNLPLSRLAEHFGCVLKEAPPAAPWAAGRLKRPLRMIEAGFLRGYPLQTLEGANMALQGWLSGREQASEKFQFEKSELAPLPTVSWEKYQPKLASMPAAKAQISRV
jgi:hypothetical protein